MSANELLEEVLREYHNRDKWDKRALSEMIEEKLSKYNEDVKKEIEEELYQILGEFYFVNDNPDVVVTPAILSEMLYYNSKEVAKNVTKILTENIKAQTTLKELSMKLYEGYGFNDKEVLDVVKKLPKYIQDDIKKSKLNKQIEKLKTKPLKIAYKKIYEAIKNQNDKALKKAIKIALEEKARYYAKRIADTEIHRATTLKRAKEYFDDKEIEFVRFEMSARHPKIDICDFYANLDVGFGRGIIPKNQMRTLPLHPHCHCIYAPYYRKVKGKQKDFKKAANETMSKFSDYEKKEILGSWDKLRDFQNGADIEEIFNRIRPKYPIRRYIDIIPKNFKENYLELNKSGYFDEKFQELDIKDICKKVGIDKKDIDEIIEKTNFKVEGAVYYRNGARFFIKGKKSEVEIPFIKNIEKFIHSHPQGTSFSAIDVELAIENKIPHIVAFNDEYFYSLKIENFSQEMYSIMQNEADFVYNILDKKRERGEILNSQLKFSIHHKIWKKVSKEIKGFKYEYYKIKR